MNVSDNTITFCIICHSVLSFLGEPLLKSIVKARMSFTCFLTSSLKLKFNSICLEQYVHAMEMQHSQCIFYVNRRQVNKVHMLWKIFACLVSLSWSFLHILISVASLCISSFSSLHVILWKVQCCYATIFSWDGKF